MTPRIRRHSRIEYAELLSRGLVLVKWWLLAIPQYPALRHRRCLIGLLVLFAGLALLFTRR